MITLTHLRAMLERALTHADNPAILRLTDSERTVEGVARAYLGEEVWTIIEWADVDDARATISAIAWRSRSAPFRARALVVALSLALGMDPGVGGLSARWMRYDNPGPADMAEHAWIVWGGDALRNNTAIQFVSNRVNDNAPRLLLAPTVAAEIDPIKALVLAVHHVLGVES